jgi:hypothetical protein
VAVRTVEVTLPGGVTALVRAVVADGDDLGEEQGATKVGAKGVTEVFNFDAVSGTIGGIAHAVHSAVGKVKPSKTTVEFGLDIAVNSGHLTALVVEGSTAASLKIALEWGGDSSADPVPQSAGAA